MGWKSTIEISKEEAVGLIMKKLLTCSNEELEDALEAFGYGEDTDLPYYGHNFIVKD